MTRVIKVTGGFIRESKFVVFFTIVHCFVENIWMSL